MACGAAALALAGAGAVLSLVAPEALAQVRAALVKNVDEPGRTPYEVYVEFSVFRCSFNCTNFTDFDPVFLFDAPAVPAGKRLIVEHVSGRLPNTGTEGVSVALQSQRIIALQHAKWAYFGPFFNQFSMAGFDADADLTYGPGEQPHFNVVLPAGNTITAFVSISGYLIDATN